MFFFLLCVPSFLTVSEHIPPPSLGDCFRKGGSSCSSEQAERSEMELMSCEQASVVKVLCFGLPTHRHYFWRRQGRDLTYREVKSMVAHWSGPNWNGFPEWDVPVQLGITTDTSFQQFSVSSSWTGVLLSSLFSQTPKAYSFLQDLIKGDFFKKFSLPFEAGNRILSTI